MKYHNELVKAGISQGNTADLLHFYETSSAHIKDLYRLPLNLVILSYKIQKK